jgi:sirohydrochlorin ferrochelatase
VTGPVADIGPVGLVVVDHGSRREESNLAHESFVRAWPPDARYVAVEPAHMELAQPSVGAAFDACVDAGATVVVVAPHFLGPGRHWDRDLPALAAEAATRHPGVAYLVSAPLGPHPLLREIIDLRVDHCLAHASGRAAECEVCAGTGRCRLR